MLKARRLDAAGMCLWPLWLPKYGALACNLLHARELTELGAVAEEHSPVRQQGQVAHLQDKTLLLVLFCGSYPILTESQRAASCAMPTRRAGKLNVCSDSSQGTH